MLSHPKKHAEAGGGFRLTNNVRMEIFAAILFSAVGITAAIGQSFDLQDLPTLTPGKTKMQNALWTETPPALLRKQTQ